MGLLDSAAYLFLFSFISFILLKFSIIVFNFCITFDSYLGFYFSYSWIV